MGFESRLAQTGDQSPIPLGATADQDERKWSMHVSQSQSCLCQNEFLVCFWRIMQRTFTGNILSNSIIILWKWIIKWIQIKSRMHIYCNSYGTELVHWQWCSHIWNTMSCYSQLFAMFGCFGFYSVVECYLFIYLFSEPHFQFYSELFWVDNYATTKFIFLQVSYIWICLEITWTSVNTEQVFSSLLNKGTPGNPWWNRRRARNRIMASDNNKWGMLLFMCEALLRNTEWRIWPIESGKGQI